MREGKRLQAAYGVSRLVRGDLDFVRMVDAVGRAIVSEGGFAAARVSIDTELDGHIFKRTTEKVETRRDPDLVRPIEWRGRTIGTVQVWHEMEEDREERSDLLAFIMPTISMALGDAITHTALIARTHELDEARDQLAATVQKLEQAEESRNRILANINHDIRTPLSTIMLSTFELRRYVSGQPDSPTGDALSRTDQSVHKLLRLVDGLLLLAARQENKLTLRIESCDVSALLRSLLGPWRTAAKEQGVALDYHGPSRLDAMVDGQALERMIANLVSNAIKFTPAGGRIEVNLVHLEGGTEISVRDTGIGLDEEFKRRIFGRFEQGRPAVRPGTSGSGIGLSIVKELAEAHKGRVDVETPIGGGSLFRIWLPRGTKAPLAAPRAVSIQSDSFSPAHFGLMPIRRTGIREVSGPHGAATVLVAEDDPQLNGALTELLSVDYRVLAAADGLSALRLAEQERPDLLVVDVGIPGIDGFELTRRFCALPENRLSPVLLLSACGELANRLSGFEAGAVEYVTKPFEPEELRARVRALLAFRSMALKLHERQQMAAIGALAGSLAREMRSPANAIVNAVEPLVELLPKGLLHEDEPIALLVNVLRDGAEQLALLSHQLLGIKRSGFERKEQHVTTFMQRCINLALPLLRGVDLRTDFKYDKTVSLAVPLMTQVITNLLEDAAQQAGIGGWVGVATRVEGQRLVIEVSDSGPGILPTLRERVFEPLFTVKPPGIGIGWGLPTSREIAVQHGGTLEVRGTDNGSLFRLEIPLSAPRSGAFENASP